MEWSDCIPHFTAKRAHLRLWRKKTRVQQWDLNLQLRTRDGLTFFPNFPKFGDFRTELKKLKVKFWPSLLRTSSLKRLMNRSFRSMDHRTDDCCGRSSCFVGASGGSHYGAVCDYEGWWVMNSSAHPAACRFLKVRSREGRYWVVDRQSVIVFDKDTPV